MPRAPTSFRRGAIARQRLRNQFLTGDSLTDPVAVVSSLGAVQAQDYAGAKWAVGQRVKGSSDALLDTLFDRGDILRTHVLRPTWHFVTPADIRWLLALTGPRVRQGDAGRRRDTGLSTRVLARAMDILQRTLEGNHHGDRKELRDALARGRVRADDTERFAHLMLFAEVEGLVCSGPRRGKQFTWALLDERVPHTTPRSREDSVRELTRRYFTTHGPATVHDFTVWSGLTMADARQGLEANGGTFSSAVAHGHTWWFPVDVTSVKRGTTAHLLPDYDEFFIGFRHREPILEAVQALQVKPTPRDLFAPILVVDGQVAGAWRRIATGASAVMELSPAVPLTDRQRRATERAAARYAAFLQVPLAIRWAR